MNIDDDVSSFFQTLLSSNLFGILISSILSLVIGFLLAKASYTSQRKQEIEKRRCDVYEEIQQILSPADVYLSPISLDERIACQCFWVKRPSQKIAYCFPAIFENWESLLLFKRQLATSLTRWKLYIDPKLFGRLQLLDTYFAEIVNLRDYFDDKQLHIMGYLLGSEIDFLTNQAMDLLLSFFTKGKARIHKTKPSMNSQHDFPNTLLYKMLGYPHNYGKKCARHCQNSICPFALGFSASAKRHSSPKDPSIVLPNS